MSLILIRYGELGLKSRTVRRKFENVLAENIRALLKDEGIEARVWPEFGRIYAGTDLNPIPVLKRVFGITSFSPAIETSSKIEDITHVAMELSKKAEKSFAIRCRRAGKHDYTSQQLAAIVGETVRKSTNARVDLDSPDFELFIEVRENKAFLFTKRIRGPGGLPLGTQGSAVARMENENDVLAAWLMMKRGVDIIPVGKEEFAAPLRKWGMKNPVLSGDLEKIADESKAEAVVTGDLLEEIKPKESSVPFIYPLIGMEQEWIRGKIDMIRKLGGEGLP